MKKCKYCKKSFTPQYTSLQPCCSIKCTLEYNKLKKLKEIDLKVKEMKPEAKSKEYKNELQRQINLLARKIDLMFGYNTCIDCGRDYGKQQDAAHFHAVGSNSTLRYNLHNLHSANSHCNKYSDVHHVNYKKGLELRYGKEYLNIVESLPIKYKEIHLSSKEVVEKLKIVRLLVRTLHTFEFSDAIDSRNKLNKIIGIYGL